MFKYVFTSCRVMRNALSAKLSSTTHSPLAIEHLKSRSVLRVSGDDTSTFIQGLITNDMRHLEEGACSMYTMFLNTKGRVMYDAIIYRAREKGTYLIECDSTALSALQKHLTLYKIRRKISLESLADSVNVWVLFNPHSGENASSLNDLSNLPGSIVPCTSLQDSSSTDDIDLSSNMIDENRLIACRDPRVGSLGYRIIAPKLTDLQEIAGNELGATEPKKNMQYKILRYKLGIGEGVDDLPPGNCFPLEANCDYLHGVSFHKGCYIGQELTARTHHTGVVRKRLMPIKFDSIPRAVITPDAPIQLPNNCSRPVGKLRGAEGTFGLALLRISQALEAPALKVLDVTCQTAKPIWWPQEAPKDRVSVGKDSNVN